MANKSPNYTTAMGYDPTTGLFVPVAVSPKTTNPVDNEDYAYLLLSGQYSLVAPTPVNGQYVPVQVDTSGNIQINLNTLLAGEDQVNNLIHNEESFTYGTEITTNNTFNAVSSVPGVLAGFFVGDPGSAWVVDVYDQTTAASPHLFKFKIPSAGTFLTKIKLLNGLTLVTSGTTPGSLLPLFR